MLNYRTFVRAKRDSMSKEEKEALLEKRRNAYRWGHFSVGREIKMDIKQKQVVVRGQLTLT